MRIVTYWADGVTILPPGHWNMIATESFVEQNLGSTLGKKYGFTKYNDGCCYKLLMLNIPTLIQDLASRSFDKTTTGVPNFPAYVSGHSTLAAASQVLSHIHLKRITKQWQSKPLTRLYGAIHYRRL
jgi:hypothetical protein